MENFVAGLILLVTTVLWILFALLFWWLWGFIWRLIKLGIAVFLYGETGTPVKLIGDNWLDRKMKRLGVLLIKKMFKEKFTDVPKE